jgi:hypothetical protein
MPFELLVQALAKKGEMNMSPVKKRSVLVPMGLGAAIVLLSAATGTVWFFVRHWDTERASPSTAQVEFDQLRARFGGEQPLLDMRFRKPLTDVNASHVPAPLHSFHTVIFDTRGAQRLVHVTVPYWFGRHYARHSGKFAWLGELTFFDDTEFDPEKIQLSLDEVERHGPGLLVDYRHPTGGQFIAWVE